MTLAKEADREKDAPRSREAIYLLLDLVSENVHRLYLVCIMYCPYFINGQSCGAPC